MLYKFVPKNDGKPFLMEIAADTKTVEHYTEQFRDITVKNSNKNMRDPLVFLGYLHGCGLNAKIVQPVLFDFPEVF